jgi:hypothetical protein
MKHGTCTTNTIASCLAYGALLPFVFGCDSQQADPVQSSAGQSGHSYGGAGGNVNSAGSSSVGPSGYGGTTAARPSGGGTSAMSAGGNESSGGAGSPAGARATSGSAGSPIAGSRSGGAAGALASAVGGAAGSFAIVTGGTAALGGGGARSSAGTLSAGGTGTSSATGGTAALSSGGSRVTGGASSAGETSRAVNFGPNVQVFDPSMSQSDVQTAVNSVFATMEKNQFGSERVALLFKPGSYAVDVNVGFYTQVAGLGINPDDVTITGAVHAEADWFSGNATQNFWRLAENLAVVPSGGADRWAVSQASPFRRMHIRGDLILDDGGWSSGGFIADSKVDGTINSGSQQQWLTRNSTIGSWKGSNWNMVFVGVAGAPSGAGWPDPPYTTIDEAPVIREKPYLYVDSSGDYRVYLPGLQQAAQGNTWSSGTTPGDSLPISSFYITSTADTAESMNAALAAGKHLLVTPGVYHLDAPIEVNRAKTVVLGLGMPTLTPDAGAVAMKLADVDGIRLAGFLFDAGPTSSAVLLQVGEDGASAKHSTDPTSLHDLFVRVGGAAVGKADRSIVINSNDVIGDHFWIWRGDHSNGVGWDVNPAENGLVVNGDDVTIYGLFVEHYQSYQTLWNGERGRVYFYQSEIPYDVPDQASWMNGSLNGYASYKVADSVQSHQAHGLGIYCYFSQNPSVKLDRAIEVPATGLNGAMFHNMTTVSLGGTGEITHVINEYGPAANGSQSTVHLVK